jgi:hypothetical protein
LTLSHPVPGHGPVAVLTGDIIRSTALSSERLQQARHIVLDAARGFEGRRPSGLGSGAEFFRGDAWQLVLSRPGGALRLALLIRARLRAEIGADTRIAIGIGGVEVIDPERTSLSLGEAFELSGRALDKMTGYFEMTAALPEAAGVPAQWLPAMAHLCSGLVGSWTRRQAEIVACALLLESPTHAQIAKALSPPVQKQSVTSILRGAHWRPLLEAIRAFEATDWAALVTKPSAASSESFIRLSEFRQHNTTVELAGVDL